MNQKFNSLLTLIILCSGLSACIVDASDLPDISKVGMDYVKGWAQNRTTEAINSFKALGHNYRPSPTYWGAEVVYQIQVDRFNNGNLTNDQFNLPASQAKYQDGPDLYGLPEYRNGGDLQGIMDRLDYLADLGVSALWLTPIFHHDGQYHGYCTTDLTTIDPGFGDAEMFRSLVQQAHARGISVVVDVVINHMCDVSSSYNYTVDHEQCCSDLNTNYWAGKPGGGNQGALLFSDNFFPPFRLQNFFNRCGPNSGSDTSGEGPAAIFGDFVKGMYDYDTRNYDWQEIFTELLKYWIAFADVDGYRLDAAKHVTDDFLAYFSTEIRAFARSIGKDNFYIVGEVAASAQWEAERLGKMMSNPNNPDDHGTVPGALTQRMKGLESTYLQDNVQPFPGLTAIYDFHASGASRTWLLGGSNLPVPSYFNSTDYRTVAAQQDPNLFWTLLEIHDWPRFLSAPQDRYNKYILISGIGYLLTAPGIPIIYYGLEQGFNGDCHMSNVHAGMAYDEIAKDCETGFDATYRQSMFQSATWRLGSAIPSVDSLNYIGASDHRLSPPWQQDPMLDRSHEAFKIARGLVHIRKSCKALNRGALYFRYVAPQNQAPIMVFSRIYQDSEILVVINPSSESFTLPPLLVLDSALNHAGMQYVNLLDTAQTFLVVNSQGGVYLATNNFSDDAHSVMVLVDKDNATGFQSNINAALCLN